MIRLALQELRIAPAQHVATLVVATIGAVLATIVIESDAVLSTQAAAGGFLAHGYVRLLLGVLGLVFLFVAVFVSCIVIANTFGIVMTARSKRIALLRLLGAESAVLRRGVAIEGAVVGAAGGLLGTVLGLVIVRLLVSALTSSGVFVPAPAPPSTPLLAVPFVVAVLSTTGAAWFGSRRVGRVSPLEAVGASVETTSAELGRRSSPILSNACLVVGGALLVAGVAVGGHTPFGLFLAAPGGAISFFGFIVGASRFLPPALRAVGLLFGRSAPARLARGNALEHPERSARSTVSLVIGVALVTMFAVAAACFDTQASAVAATAGPAEAAGDAAFVRLVLGVLGVLIGFSLAIAAVGLVNSLSLGVLQRRREIGLLRAMGLDRGQVRLMVLLESIQIACAGGLCGLVLGIVYGSAAAWTALASDHHIGGYFIPTIPVPFVAGVIAACGALAVVASLAPTARANRVSPVVALSVE